MGGEQEEEHGEQLCKRCNDTGERNGPGKRRWGLNQGGSNEVREKWLDSGYILKEEPTEFGSGCENEIEERELKDDCNCE